MCKSQSCGPFYETHIELAVAVFKTQDQRLVNSLKNFLTLLPSPQCLEDVLKFAICQSAISDSDSCRWVLTHPSYMEPELDVNHFILESVTIQLQNQGFVLNQDFWLDPNNQLYLNIHEKANIKVEDLANNASLLRELFISHQKDSTH
jgi:hypothetical protein